MINKLQRFPLLFADRNLRNRSPIFFEATAYADIRQLCQLAPGGRSTTPTIPRSLEIPETPRTPSRDRSRRPDLRNTRACGEKGNG